MANAVVSVGRNQPDMNGHYEDTELLGLLGGREKGSESYKGDGINIKDGMVEPCPVRSNRGSCLGFRFGGGTFGRHGQERMFMQLQLRAVGFGLSDLGPEGLTSNGGSWLLGRRRRL